MIDAAAPTDARACGCDSCLAGQCVKLAFAFKRFYVGDTDRGEIPSSAGWYDLGLNLDGVESRYAFNGECKPIDGSIYPAPDGYLGIDNNWAQYVLPALKTYDPTPTKTVDDAIAAGGTTPLLALGPIAVDRAGPTLAAFFTLLDSVEAKPAFDGHDARVPLALPALAFADAVIGTGGAFDSAAAPSNYALTLAIGPAPIVLPLRGLRMKMTLGPSNAVSNGELGAAIAVDDLKAAVADHLARIDPSQCGDAGAKVLQLDRVIDSSADVLADGSHDPTRTCDAVSFGAGFDVALVSVNGVGAAPATLPQPCP